MPSVDRVKAQIQGKDPTDTAARQVAVFTYLQQYIQRIAYNKNPRATIRRTSPHLRCLLDAAVTRSRRTTTSPTHQPKPRPSTPSVQLHDEQRQHWIKGLIGPQTASAYQGRHQELAARQKAHIDSINHANEEAKAAAASSVSGAGGNANDPTALAARRCAELGGTTGGCATKSFGQGLMAMFGGEELSDQVESVQNVGVYLSGIYHNPSTSTQLRLRPQPAQLTGCGKLVADDRAYNLQRTPSGVRVTSRMNRNQSPSLFVLNGSLIGPGPR